MDALLVMFGLAALVWCAVFMARVNLITGCLVFLVASCCLSKHFYNLGGPLELTVDRLLFMLVVGKYALFALLNKNQPKALTKGDWILIAFVTWLVVRTFTSDWNQKFPSPDHVSPVWHLLIGYITPLLIYWIARQSPINAREVNRVHVGLMGFGIYLATIGLCEACGAWSLVFPKYIADPEIGIHFGRARGPMLEAARFGFYLVICLTVTWTVLVWRKRWGRAGQLATLILVPAYGAAIWFTYTRSVWMGAGAALLIALALTLRKRWRPLVVGYLVAAVCVAAFMKRDSLVAFDRDYNTATMRKSTYMRASFAYVSWQMFKDRPLAGFGFSQFPVENQVYLSDRSADLQLEEIRGYINHNTLLSILVDTGIIGLALFVALLSSCVLTAWKLWRDQQMPDWARAHGLIVLCTLAAFLFQLLFREVSYTPIEYGIICLLAGMATGLRATLGDTPAVAGRPANPRFGWPTVPSLQR